MGAFSVTYRSYRAHGCPDLEASLGAAIPAGRTFWSELSFFSYWSHITDFFLFIFFLFLLFYFPFPSLLSFPFLFFSPFSLLNPSKTFPHHETIQSLWKIRLYSLCIIVVMVPSRTYFWVCFFVLPHPIVAETCVVLLRAKGLMPIYFPFLLKPPTPSLPKPVWQLTANGYKRVLVLSRAGWKSVPVLSSGPQESHLIYLTSTSRLNCEDDKIKYPNVPA